MGRRESFLWPSKIILQKKMECLDLALCEKIDTLIASNTTLNTTLTDFMAFVQSLDVPYFFEYVLALLITFVLFAVARVCWLVVRWIIF